MNLLRYRRLAKWSQEELSFQAQVTRPAISELETGSTQSPDIKTMTLLAGALGVTVADLLRDDNCSIDAELQAFVESDLARHLNPTEEELELLRMETAGLWVLRRPSSLSLYHLVLAIRGRQAP